MRIALLAALALLVVAAPASAAPRLVKVGDFTSPSYVTSPPNDVRLFVVEQRGTIKIAGSGKTFLDNTAATEDGYTEQGLLSMAFAPDYAASGLFYIAYTNSANALAVDELRRSADPDAADPGSRRPVIAIPRDSGNNLNHNGGQLQFGPDGMLYVSTGDGGASNDPGDDAANTALAAREDPARQPARRAPGEPVRQRGLGLRPAQPVALLVRPRERRPDDRRRRPGPPRGDRLRAGAPRAPGAA